MTRQSTSSHNMVTRWRPSRKGEDELRRSKGKVQGRHMADAPEDVVVGDEDVADNMAVAAEEVAGEETIRTTLRTRGDSQLGTCHPLSGRLSLLSNASMS